jgi:hypothetical protein
MITSIEPIGWPFAEKNGFLKNALLAGTKQGFDIKVS